MAYSIGPRFNNTIDAGTIANRYTDEVKAAREEAGNNFDRLMTGIKGIGTGVGKARQWMEAERIKKELMDRLKQMQDARFAASNELAGLDQNPYQNDAQQIMMGFNPSLDLSIGRKAGL